MIIPSRHTNINLCILRIGSLILEFIRRNGPTRADELVSALEARIEHIQIGRIVETLVFLYAMGAIEYLDYDDVFLLQADIDRMAASA